MKINFIKSIFFLLLIVPLSSCMTNSSDIQSNIKAVGKGGYRIIPNSNDNPPPIAVFRSAEMKKRAVPTNQWYSSVMYTQWSETIFATPLSLKPTNKGFEVSLGMKKVVPTYRKDVDIFYPHTADITVQANQLNPQKAILSDFSDWTAVVDLTNEQDFLKASISHGSPFVYFHSSKPQIDISLLESFSATYHANTLLVINEQKSYAIFAPTGSIWQRKDDLTWTLKLADNKNYFSLASLPNKETNTLNKFQESAFVFIKKTQVDWKIDNHKKIIETQYNYEVDVKEGYNSKAIIGLYPHHYHQNNLINSDKIGDIQSIRGTINYYQTNSFTTQQKHRGFVPYWPTLQNNKLKNKLHIQLNRDSQNARRMILEEGEGPYWQGKGLQRISQLMNVAVTENQEKIKQRLLELLKKRMQKWLSGTNHKRYFHYDKKSGTVVSYPEEYDAVIDMNDHHFHYGYWIRAAAEIGLQDRDWIAHNNWGAMIKLLIKDIATSERERSDFPFLRNFDPFEGHSWASGVARGNDGNNQESTSEAINAWASLILWGSVTNQPELIDLGTYLYNTEIQSAQYYWFDVYDITLPDEYLNEDVCILFGGKLVHYTWWIDEPRQIHGINFLPITPSSTYLGEYPEYVKQNLKALEKETQIYESQYKKAKPIDIWQDIFAKYLALADPTAGFAAWDEWGSFELGDTRSHTLHWLSSLNTMGTADLNITADTTFYAVFKKANSKTYLTYNTDKTEKTVTFSDGTTLIAKPNQLSSKVKNI